MTVVSPTPQGFETTRWTLILGARADREALAELLRRYWWPIFAFLRRYGQGAHDAADLTQGFLTDVFLGRDVVDPRRSLEGGSAGRAGAVPTDRRRRPVLLTRHTPGHENGGGAGPVSRDGSP